MNATLEPNGHADSQASAAQTRVGEQFEELFEGVEDLLKRVAESDSPEIQKIRAKARVALVMAKSAIQDGAIHVGRRAQRAAGATDEYLREYPWYALGLGTLVGFGLGLVVARTRE
jgi:ElaB/YqjD/DUF883 family membrane-anchored ribosome-binding protein